MLDVIGMLVFIDIVGNLVDAWQRMENLHVRLGQLEHVAVEDVHILDALVFHQVAETLLLHACHI